ncbi:MAG: cell surface protein [Candidatus Magnetoglobus multicellularis str. Araruama]|uniref:Cell surface protein n=1 Tax=Candidatus Magnetoglobus multicellularis str. Araruama TaxID=890399 RepID=A0A1V1NVG9_9BACT|nr:MAG: cell surface protein [Candidatus Magnetoglobus multicellularis str. Araruama]
MNEKGLSWINKKGVTKLGLRSSRDINQSEPFQHEFINIWSSESNTPYKPYLVVEYQENQKEESPWPMFRNNIRHTGKCSYRTTGGLPSVKWKCDTNGDNIYSSPSIGADGTIYIGMQKNSGEAEYFYAINPNGSIKWQYPMGSSVSVYASPAIDSNGNIFIGAYYSYVSYKDKGYIYGFKPNGNLIFKNYIGQTEIKSSPVIDSQGTIYIGTDEGTLHAFYSDGTEKWRYDIGKDIKSTPAIASDGTIYFGSNDYHMYAITSEGEFKCRFSTNGYIESSPAISEDGTIYFGSNDEYLYAIKEDNEGFNLIWKYFIDYKVRSSPAIGSDGTIYVSASSTWSPYNGYLYAINKDGSLKWKYYIKM